jgi:hypothetical protein
VSGFASGPGFSSAVSNADTFAEASIVNQTGETVMFPFTISHSRSVSTFTIPSSSQSESVTTAAQFTVLFDSNRLLHNSSFVCAPFVPVENCNSFDSGSNAFSFTLTPGSHRLSLHVAAVGQATSSPVGGDISATPEPATLLLVGTTAAGLGLARWRQRRKQQTFTLTQ